MGFKYDKLDSYKGQLSDSWTTFKDWQYREEQKENGVPVMVNVLEASNSDHAYLVGRYHEEVRRIFFKVSNLPDASLATLCLERAFKSTLKNGYPLYTIITKGWYSTSLNDLFSANAKYKRVGDQYRQEFRSPRKRSKLWQALLPIAQLLQRMQQGKMFCPPLTLSSLVFLEENIQEEEKHVAGCFNFEDLRLIGLEKTIPFGRLESKDIPNSLVHEAGALVPVAIWKSLAEIVIDILFGPLPDGISAEKMAEFRIDGLAKALRDGNLIHEEHSLIDQMLNARDDFSLGDVCGSIEKLCYMRSGGSNKLKAPEELSIVYYKHEGFEGLVDNGEQSPLSMEDRINKYLAKRISQAVVLFDADDLRKNGSFTLYFDCGDGLYFRGEPYLDRNFNEHTTSVIVIKFQNRLNISPDSAVSLYNTKITCASSQSRWNGNIPITGHADWAEELKRRVGLTRKAKMKAKELQILATLELANQLESLMAFLALYICRVENVYERADGKLEVCLAPLTDGMLNEIYEDDIKDQLSKVKEIQDDIRDIMNQKGEYGEHLFRHLKDQLERPNYSSSNQHKSSELLITNWDTAGSLSLNPMRDAKSNTTLDDVSWKVDTEAIYSDKATTIKAERFLQLSRKEKSIFKEGSFVSIRTRGHYGQMEVIKRRTDAFDHLKKYDMLIQQLVSPSKKNPAFIDCDNFREMAESRLYGGDPDPDRRLDENKMAIIEDIYRMAPLFALQGPPGTGKSETVCAVTKIIFMEDPMAQIMLTSRENDTVKELLRKLYSESQVWGDRPIFKLSSKIQASMVGSQESEKGKESFLAVSLDEQTMEILRHAVEQQNSANISGVEANLQPILMRWSEYLEEIISRSEAPAEGLSSRRFLSSTEGIKYLMEQSANLVFTTASDKGLAEMVSKGYMYDWAFVEEAGKTPFYDLILPMLVSQRWVLLGDPQQLKPFQSTEFESLMHRYKESVEMLEYIKKIEKGGKDYVSLHNVKAILDGKCDGVLPVSGGREEGIFDREWILPFKKIFDSINPQDETRSKPNSETAAALNVVYRMPPILTELVNQFYEEIDLKPAPMTRGEGKYGPSPQKSNPVTSPAFMRQCNGLWIDTMVKKAYLQQDQEKQVWNTGEAQLISSLLANMEIDSSYCGKPTLAVLTPYRKQVRELNDQLIKQDDFLKENFTPVVMKDKNTWEWASTIDSFQGSQADIIVVSMVRNSGAHNETNPDTIRFVTDENRLNVMISRAQRLLIVVGSWEYFNTCYQGYEKDWESHTFKKFLINFKNMSQSADSAPYLKIKTVDEVGHCLKATGENI